MGLRIADIPPERRPREKALAKGLESLSDIELLAILIGKGTSGRSALDVASSLYGRYGSLGELFASPYENFSSDPGISTVKSLELGAVGELLRRCSEERLSRSSFPTAKEIFECFGPSLKRRDDEALLVLLYDRRGRYLGERIVSKGLEGNAGASQRAVLRCALDGRAHAFYLVHNHPSGDPDPSEEDDRATMALQGAALKVGLKLKDHVIVAEKGYFSFLSAGLLLS